VLFRSILLTLGAMAGHRNIPLTFLDIAIFDVRLPIAQLANNIERQTAGTTDRCQAIAAIFSGTVAPLIVIYLFIFFVLWRRCRKIVGVIKQNNIPIIINFIENGTSIT